MNNDYESVAKEIDEMLIERQIDKLRLTNNLININET